MDTPGYPAVASAAVAGKNNVNSDLTEPKEQGLDRRVEVIRGKGGGVEGAEVEEWRGGRVRKVRRRKNDESSNWNVTNDIEHKPVT